MAIGSVADVDTAACQRFLAAGEGADASPTPAIDTFEPEP
jgi:hypothetical protein